MGKNMGGIMKKILEIKDGVITNIIVVDENNIPDWCVGWPELNDEVNTGVSIGDLYDSDGKISPAVPSEELLANQIRDMRNKLIAETDWWASSDIAMTQDQIDYRKALRDITLQETFPESVVWPTKPV